MLASGGNHGLAVAHVSRTLGIPARVFVPETAPQAKVSRLRALGAEVRQVGQVYADALLAGAAAAAEPGAMALHAYDAPATVTGQGTLGLELDERHTTDHDLRDQAAGCRTTSSQRCVPPGSFGCGFRASWGGSEARTRSPAAR